MISVCVAVLATVAVGNQDESDALLSARVSAKNIPEYPSESHGAAVDSHFYIPDSELLPKIREVLESMKDEFKGDKGEKGDSGDDGRHGNHGVDGKDGEQGEKGVDGNHGVNGNHGTDGRNGAKGGKGDKGDKGDHASVQGWRIWADTTTSGYAWDVYRLKFIAYGTEMQVGPCTVVESDHSGGHDPENAFQDDGALWGGRRVGDEFFLGLECTAPLSVEVKLHQGCGHAVTGVGTAVKIQKKVDGNWIDAGVSENTACDQEVTIFPTPAPTPAHGIGGQQGAKGDQGDAGLSPYVGHGACRSQFLNNDIFVSRSNSPESFGSSKYNSWKVEALKRCKARFPQEVTYVTVWKDSGYRCYSSCPGLRTDSYNINGQTWQETQ